MGIVGAAAALGHLKIDTSDSVIIDNVNINTLAAGGNTGEVTIKHTNALRIVNLANILADGPISFLSGGPSSTVQTFGTLTTTADAILVESPLTMVGNTAFTTGAASVGNITMQSTVNGAFTLGFNAGTGNLDLQGEVGGTAPPTQLLITDATNVTAEKVTAIQIDQVAGSGLTTIDDDWTATGLLSERILLATS